MHHFGPEAAARSRPKGFSLVELLVAIAIIGILVGLSVVAVSRARETARQITCRNNLRQLGMALQSYHTGYGAFPPAVIWEPPGEPLGRGLYPIGIIDRVALAGDVAADTIYQNWAIMLLPRLDASGLYNSFDASVPISHERNRSGRETPLPVMSCPSDVFNRTDNLYERGSLVGLTTNRYARGNYGVNVGPDSACVEGMGTPENPCIGGFIVAGTDLLTTNYQVWGSGVAGVNRSFATKDISDGLSHTIFLDEIRAGLHPLDPRGTWCLGQSGASALIRHGREAGGPNPSRARPDQFIGCEALRAAVGGLVYREVMGCWSFEEGELNAQSSSRSMHPGGVHVLLADGSVRFIADSIERDVWQAAHTRNRGENETLPKP